MVTCGHCALSMRSVITRSAKIFVLPTPLECVSERRLRSELKNIACRFHHGNKAGTLPHFFRELSPIEQIFFHQALSEAIPTGKTDVAFGSGS
jgi:hypothetical protein